MKNILLFIICFLFLVACSRGTRNHKDKDRIVIDIDDLEELSFYDVFTKMELFPLETINESLIQNIAKVVMHKGFIYILDDALNTIFVFNQEGKYIQKINKYGSGPGEYTALNDFRFNDGNLELLSPMSGIYVYDSLEVTYKYRVRLPSTLRAVHYFIDIAPEQYLFFSDSEEGDKMYFYNSKQDKVTSHIYDVPTYLLINTLYHHVSSPFYSYNGIPHFVQGYDGTVFMIEDGKLLPKYQWDFGDYNFDLDNLPPNKDVSYYFMYHRTTGVKYATMFITYCENSRYYSTQFYLKNRIYKLFYDKINQHPIVFNCFKEVDIAAPIVMDDLFAYSIVTPDVLNKFINLDLLDEENKKRFESVTAESNSVVIRYAFKK